MYWPDLWGIWGSPPKTQSEAEVAADRSTRHRTRTISIVETTTIASSWRQLKITIKQRSTTNHRRDAKQTKIIMPSDGKETVITLKGSVQTVSEFFFTAINSILYQRGKQANKLFPLPFCSCVSSTNKLIIPFVSFIPSFTRNLSTRNIQTRIKVWIDRPNNYRSRITILPQIGNDSNGIMVNE